MASASSEMEIKKNRNKKHSVSAGLDSGMDMDFLPLKPLKRPKSFGCNRDIVIGAADASLSLPLLDLSGLRICEDSPHPMAKSCVPSFKALQKHIKKSVKETRGELFCLDLNDNLMSTNFLQSLIARCLKNIDNLFILKVARNPLHMEILPFLYAELPQVSFFDVQGIFEINAIIPFLETGLFKGVAIKKTIFLPEEMVRTESWKKKVELMETAESHHCRYYKILPVFQDMSMRRTNMCPERLPQEALISMLQEDMLSRVDLEKESFLSGIRKAFSFEDRGASIATKIGIAFYNGSLHLRENHLKARAWLEYERINGSAEASYYLGLLYHYGKGVEANCVKKRDLFAEAIAKGSTGAALFQSQLRAGADDSQEEKTREVLLMR